jgi:hypothetical protein
MRAGGEGVDGQLAALYLAGLSKITMSKIDYVSLQDKACQFRRFSGQILNYFL